MPVGCGIAGGLGYTCLVKNRISGIKQAWLFNLDLLRTAIDPNGTGYVQGLEFTGYDGLYRYDAGKFSHSATSAPNKNTDTGAGTFLQTVVLQLWPQTPEDLATIADIMVADALGAIVLTNNNEFRIYGAQNGLTASSDGQVNPTGKNQGESTVTIITLVGEENLPYRIFFRTDYNTTLNLIESYEF